MVTNIIRSCTLEIHHLCFIQIKMCIKSALNLHQKSVNWALNKSFFLYAYVAH